MVRKLKIEMEVLVKNFEETARAFATYLNQFGCLSTGVWRPAEQRTSEKWFWFGWWKLAA